MKTKLLPLVAIMALPFATNVSAEALTVDKLNSLNQLHDVAISPDGSQLLFGLKKGLEKRH